MRESIKNTFYMLLIIICIFTCGKSSIFIDVQLYIYLSKLWLYSICSTHFLMVILSSVTDYNLFNCISIAEYYYDSINNITKNKNEHKLFLISQIVFLEYILTSEFVGSNVWIFLRHLLYHTHIDL